MSIKYLQPHASDPDPLLAAVLAQMKRDFGLASEPLRLHAPAPRILAAVWSALRETVLAGRVPRAVKETVAATISRLNRCPYCVDAHTSMVHASGARATARILRRGDREVTDPSLRPFVDWAAATRRPGAAVLRHPPFGPEEAPEMIGTAACFHYVNRMVTIFLGETPFPTRNRWLSEPVFLLTSRFFAPYVRGRHPPGESLHLLPAAELPADLAWARPSPILAAAFANLSAAVEDGVREVLPEEVRGRLLQRIDAWNGEDLELGGGAIEEAVLDWGGGLDGRSSSPARLALLAALAPYRVDAAEVARFRQERPDDRSLVSVLAWGSFAAARRVTSWLAPTDS